MTSHGSRAVAFLRRDAAQYLSYPLPMLADLANVLAFTILFFFLARLIDSGHSELLVGGYFGFALIGIAFWNFLSLLMQEFGQQIRQGQLSGTLETVFTAPMSDWEIVVWNSLWSCLYHSARIVLFLLVGVLFGLPIDRANWLGVLVVFTLSVVALVPLGILTAAFVLVWKKGESLAFLISTSCTLFAGVLYPVEVLPGPLQVVSALLPLSHAIASFRMAFLEGAGPLALTRSLAALALIAAVGMPLAIWAFRAAAQSARRTGTLGSY